MRIAIEVDEHAFVHPKSKEDVEREVMEAASIHWLARRDIEQARARSVVRPSSRDLVEVLLSAPAVGQDSDFERAQDLGRPGIEWETWLAVNGLALRGTGGPHGDRSKQTTLPSR